MTKLSEEGGNHNDGLLKFSKAGTYTILGNGHTITSGYKSGTMNAEGPIVTAWNGAVVNLGDPNAPDKSGLTIDGQNIFMTNDLVFVHDNSTINMYSGTTICNGSSWGNRGGIGVVVYGTFNMYGGSIENNDSTLFGGAIALMKQGGNPEDPNTAVLNIYGGTIKNNKAGSYGGAIYNPYGSPIHIENCTFSGNTAKRGGAIYSQSGAVEIKNCTFQNNSASYISNGKEYSDGGAIYSLEGSVKISNSKFDRNSVGRYGGAIFANQVSTITIENSTFQENHAGQIGGAVTLNAAGTIKGSTFNGNTSNGAGGGLFTFAATNIESSLFTGNSSAEGGGIYAQECDLIIDNNSAVYLNSATSMGDDVVIYNEDAHNVTLPMAAAMRASGKMGSYKALGWFEDGGDGTRYNAETHAEEYTKLQYTDVQLGAALKVPVEKVPTAWDKLTVEKRADKTTAKPSEEVTYTIKVTNGTGKDLTGVKVSDTLDEDLEFVSADNDGTNNEGTVTWTIDSLANGESKTLTLKVTVDSKAKAGTIKNTAVITEATDPDGDGLPEGEKKPEGSTDVTVIGGGNGGGGTTYYILHYESNGGTKYKDERYASGTTVKLDKVPTREGYVFTGWYADKALTERITSIKMTRDETVYAGWRGTESGFHIPDFLNGENHFAYVVGYPDGTVRPNNKITRAEVAMIFYRLLKDNIRSENERDVNTFSDVETGMWYNTAVSTIAGLGIMVGRSDKVFDPNAPITRAEFATVCARFDQSEIEEACYFSDISGHWAEAFIERASALGWVAGYKDGTFRPENYITRAEAMTMINRVLGRLPEDEDDLLPGMRTWPDNADPDAWYYLAVQEATNGHNFNRKSDGVHERWTELTANP